MSKEPTYPATEWKISKGGKGIESERVVDTIALITPSSHGTWRLSYLVEQEGGEQLYTSYLFHGQCEAMQYAANILHNREFGVGG